MQENLVTNDNISKKNTSSKVSKEDLVKIESMLSQFKSFQSQNEFHEFLFSLGKELYNKYSPTENIKYGATLSNYKNGEESTYGLKPSDKNPQIIPELTVTNQLSQSLSLPSQEGYKAQEDNYLALIKSIGEDPSREGLLKTPHRAAKALRELTVGYCQDLETLVNGAIYKSDGSEMVVVRDIELYSMCEHHMLPFMGKCHLGYIPKGKVIGLSKLARIVDLFARRLQIQEKLTHEIATTIENVIDADGVAVIIEAEHMCMRMRGVGKQNSTMQTSTMLGQFKKESTLRNEFLTLINRK